MSGIVLDFILEKSEIREKKAFIPELIKKIKIDSKVWQGKPVRLQYICRLSTTEKTTIESLLNQEIYLNDGQKLYNKAWLIDTGYRWEMKKNADKPWRATLVFIITE